MSEDADLINFPLTSDERNVLEDGLLAWGGPARCTDALAFAMGFGTVDELFSVGDRLRDVLCRGEAMSAFDGTRVLGATEIAFASDVFGSGVEWSITTRWSDEDTIRILRGLQRKLVDAYGPLRGQFP